MTYEDTRKWVLGCIYHDGFIETKRGDRANKVIKEAVEKQMPKKPKREKRHESVDGHYCPTCGFRVLYHEVAGWEWHCEHCGQAIDWSDSE